MPVIMSFSSMESRHLNEPDAGYTWERMSTPQHLASLTLADYMITPSYFKVKGKKTEILT